MTTTSIENNLSVRLINSNEVAKRTSYHPVSISRLVKNGSFPPPYRIGENRVAWVEAEVTAWIAEKIRGKSNDPSQSVAP